MLGRVLICGALLGSALSASPDAAAQDAGPRVGDATAPRGEEVTSPASGSHGEHPPQPEQPGAEGEHAPFIQQVPGTTVQLSMVPLPSALLPGAPTTGAPAAEGVPAADDETPADPGPRRLWVAATETTWDAYDAFVFELDQPDPEAQDGVDAVVRPSKPYVLADYGFGRAGYPVICVNPNGAQAFCEWLSALSGRRYRLPTEAEWRAMAAAVHPELCADAIDGDGPQVDRDALEAVAWVKENARRGTRPVGSLAAGRLGIHDVLGNVTEWCTDANGEPVAMGGCWSDRARDVNCASRKVPDGSWNAHDPQIPKSVWWLSSANYAGFRVVCEDVPSRR